jgi:hypothetical protein
MKMQREGGAGQRRESHQAKREKFPGWHRKMTLNVERHL